jgi:DUF917 family protein
VPRLLERDLVHVAAGAAILGSGGGGDPWIGRLLAQSAVRRHGPVDLVRLTDVPDDAVVLSVGLMGAPTVAVEKVPSIEQAAEVAIALGTYLGTAATHVACAEAGGVNSLIPVAAAAALGLPLIDADGMGRAFPELQMVLPTLYGVRATPMAIADEKGNRGIIDTIDNRWAERLARSATIDMGCSAMISSYPMTGRQARESLAPGTLSLCAELGRLLSEAHAGHADPVRTVVDRLGGRQVFAGKVLDVARRTQTGFARGEATLSGMDGHLGEELALQFQNEHLVARTVAPSSASATAVGRVLASVPDLICVLEAETGAAVTTEALRFGQRVKVIVAPCDPRWHSPAGLELAGPRYFGYDHDPVPVGGAH